MSYFSQKKIKTWHRREKINFNFILYPVSVVVVVVVFSAQCGSIIIAALML